MPVAQIGFLYLAAKWQRFKRKRIFLVKKKNKNKKKNVFLTKNHKFLKFSQGAF